MPTSDYAAELPICTFTGLYLLRIKDKILYSKCNGNVLLQHKTNGLNYKIELSIDKNREGLGRPLDEELTSVISQPATNVFVLASER